MVSSTIEGFDERASYCKCLLWRRLSMDFYNNTPALPEECGEEWVCCWRIQCIQSWRGRRSYCRCRSWKESRHLAGRTTVFLSVITSMELTLQIMFIDWNINDVKTFFLNLVKVGCWLTFHGSKTLLLIAWNNLFLVCLVSSLYLFEMYLQNQLKRCSETIWWSCLLFSSRLHYTWSFSSFFETFFHFTTLSD